MKETLRVAYTNEIHIDTDSTCSIHDEKVNLFPYRTLSFSFPRYCMVDTTQ